MRKQVYITLAVMILSSAALAQPAKPKSFVINGQLLDDEVLCTAALVIGTGASAQQTDLSRISARTVTLISQARHKDYKKSVFNFQYGRRGDQNLARQPSVDEPPETRRLGELSSPLGDYEVRSPRRTHVASTLRASYDIRYGGISLQGEPDWLDIPQLSGTQSVVKDMGELSWAEVRDVPVLPASPQPYAGGHAYSFRRGVIQVSPEGVVVKAVPGHMYVLHVKDQEADYYVMFRVEEIDPKGECRLTWKRVPSPEK